MKDPRLVVNGKGNWHTVDSVVGEFTRGAAGEQDKAYLLWENMRRNIYHWWPAVGGHDPLQLLNTYGFALCDQSANAAVSLFLGSGLAGSRVLALGGHVVSEAMVEGQYQLLDTDMGVFYLDRENERPVSAEDCARDPDLIRRELIRLPSVSPSGDGRLSAALYGPDDGPWPFRADQREITLSLRPGEKVVYRWNNIGKIAPLHYKEKPASPPCWGNSTIVYKPHLDLFSLRENALSVDEVLEGMAGGGRTAMVSGPVMGSLVFEVAVPYAICGGKVTALLSGPDYLGRFVIEVSPEGKEWKEVSKGYVSGIVSVAKRLDEALGACDNDPRYRYFLRISFGGAGPAQAVHLRALTIETDMMTAPPSLPGLSMGGNRVSYSDAKEGEREVIVTHEWRENTSHVPPGPPDGAVAPEDGEEVLSSIVLFSWPRVEGADLYHLRVSRRPDMAVPFRPSLDKIISTNTYSLPFAGAFSPNVTYYYRLRSGDVSGAWGPWSRRRSFTWQGPGVPKEVRLRFDGQVGTLLWAPSDRGTRPVRYAVFGSDEKGFSLSYGEGLADNGVEGRGGLAGETTSTEMVVVSGEKEGEGLNRTFYRVVAIDGNGTESGPSDFAEAPHPFIFSVPETAVRGGEAYSYNVRSLLSRGSLQRRSWGTDSPRDQFAYLHEEQHLFELIEGPNWLSIDADTGLLEGLPAEDGEREWRVKVGVRNQFQGYDEQAFVLQFAP